MKFSALFLCVFISVTASANSFDTPVRDLLADYLNTKDATKVSEAMMRCAALISLTNAMAQDVPNTIRIDPNALFAAVLHQRVQTESESDAVKSVLNEFKANATKYQTWMKSSAEANDDNPFADAELQQEFQICDEGAREFLSE